MGSIKYEKDHAVGQVKKRRAAMSSDSPSGRNLKILIMVKMP